MDVMTDEDDGHIDKLHLLEVLKIGKYENFLLLGIPCEAAGRQHGKSSMQMATGMSHLRSSKGMKDKLGVLCPKSTVLRERYDDIIKSI